MTRHYFSPEIALVEADTLSPLAESPADLESSTEGFDTEFGSLEW